MPSDRTLTRTHIRWACICPPIGFHDAVIGKPYGSFELIEEQGRWRLRSFAAAVAHCPRGAMCSYVAQIPPITKPYLFLPRLSSSMPAHKTRMLFVELDRIAVSQVSRRRIEYK
jgi:hypothetical protein